MVTLPGSGTVRWLWRILVFLNLMNLVFIVIHRGFGYEGVLGLAPAFRTDREQNAPTWFSVCLLCAAGLLLLAIAAQERRDAGRYRHHWLALGLIFLALSLDELMGLHEGWGYLMPYLFPAAFDYQAWNVVYLIPMLVFARVYWPFWRSLDRPTQRGLMLAGLLYVGGAMGVELIDNLLWLQTHSRNLGTDLATAVEEAMEMSGVVILIRTLLAHLAGGGDVSLQMETTSESLEAAV